MAPVTQWSVASDQWPVTSPSNVLTKTLRRRWLRHVLRRPTRRNDRSSDFSPAPCPRSPTPCLLFHGFTLVELLIASTMIAILFVGLGAHLRGGLMVWQRTTASGETLQRRRVAFDQLERDLGNALVYDSRSRAYGSDPGQMPLPQFGAATLRFYTVVGAAASPSPAVRVVTYACESPEGKAGLWRSSQTVEQARAKIEAPIPELLLPGCESLSLRYAYLPAAGSEPFALEWRENWPDDPGAITKLPRLLEISLVVAGHPLRRRYAIPPGALGQSQLPSPGP